MSPNAPLYIAVVLYACASLVTLISLVRREQILQRFSFLVAIGGFIAHTIWIGIICTRTQHPPLTNLPEACAFIAWTLMAIEIGVYLRYRIHAASFFVYPLVVLLLSITAIVREPFAHLEPSLRSNLFLAHLLFTTVGVAGLLIALIFALLYRLQERSIKSKSRGAFYDWIPSLQMCDLLSYRSLAIGFSLYTIGIVTGALWSYRTNAGVLSLLRAKELGALVAWMLFAILLQSYLNGTFRTQKNVIISAAAFLSIVVAILGIHRV
ncbi:MAG TPA: cytochrome c biogenesis protein CcsA [Thermoanaerobaculia bacterium]|nr:cytochrome c biogenesis protein CcsA [Thermoanaerobaculia bacterium]